MVSVGIDPLDFFLGPISGGQLAVADRDTVAAAVRRIAHQYAASQYSADLRTHGLYLSGACILCRHQYRPRSWRFRGLLDIAAFRLRMDLIVRHDRTICDRDLIHATQAVLCIRGTNGRTKRAVHLTGFDVRRTALVAFDVHICRLQITMVADADPAVAFDIQYGHGCTD